MLEPKEITSLRSPKLTNRAGLDRLGGHQARTQVRDRRQVSVGHPCRSLPPLSSRCHRTPSNRMFADSDDTSPSVSGVGSHTAAWPNLLAMQGLDRLNGSSIGQCEAASCE